MAINRTGGLISRKRIILASLNKSSVGALLTAAGGAFFMPAGAANATDVNIVPRIEARETYTDNVLLTPDNEQSDFVSVFSPGVNIELEGPKLNGTVDYEAGVLYFPSQNDAQVRHDLNARLQLEAVNNFFFIDGTARISEQFINRNAGFSFSDDNFTGNRSTIQTYNLSPSFRGRIEQFATWDLSYRYGLVFSEQGGSGLPNDPAQVFTDSRDHTASLRFASGPQFRTLSWTASGNLRRTNRDGPGTNFKDDQLRLDLNYRVSRVVSLTAGAGYEHTNLVGIARGTDGDGVLWDVGINLTPSRRTNFSARYGRRINQEVVSANFLHRLNSAITFTANYSDTFQSSQSLLTGQLPGIIIGNDGSVTDPNGLPLPADLPGFDLNNLNFRQQRGTFGVTYRRDRTNFTLFTSYEERTFNIGEPEEKGFSGNFVASRQFSRRSSANVRLTYRHDEFRGIMREDDLYGAQARYSYRLSQNFSANLSYILTYRDSNTAQFDITENAITLGIQATF